MIKFSWTIPYLSHRLHTEVLSLDVVDGAGVGQSAQQVVELLEAAGWDVQMFLILAVHLLSFLGIQHWEHSFLHS